MRKITYFTGSRSEYGLMRSLLKEMDKNPNLKLDLIVTGTHLSKKYGYSVNEIKGDGFEILAELDILQDDEDEISMVEAFSKCVIGVAKILKENKPDFLLIQGDRSESLAAVIAASHLNLVIVHLSGGDITYGGTIDDRVRPAISDFAQIHFPSTKRSADVLLNRGEEPWRINYVGNPGVNLKEESFTDKKKLADKFDIDIQKDLIVVIQHPVEPENAGKQMDETMSAVKELGIQTIVIHPNADTGSQSIVDVIKKYENSSIKSYETLSRSDFIGLLRIAKTLVGNSSCGIAEAPSLSLPVVDIGERQSGREKMSNVIDVGYNKNQIKEAIKKAINMNEKIDLEKIPYYMEGSEQKIVKILSEIEMNEDLLKKRWIL